VNFFHDIEQCVLSQRVAFLLRVELLCLILSSLEFLARLAELSI